MSGIPRLSYDLGKIWLLYLIYLTEYEALCKYMSLLDIDSLFKNIGLEKKLIFVLTVCLVKMRVPIICKHVFISLPTNVFLKDIWGIDAVSNGSACT